MAREDLFFCDGQVWNTRSVDGVYRFLARVHRLYAAHAAHLDSAATPEQLATLHAAIKRVTEDTEEMRFNTAISAMMEFTNAAGKWPVCGRGVLEPFALLLAPYAPHLAEELWGTSSRSPTRRGRCWTSATWSAPPSPLPSKSTGRRARGPVPATPPRPALRNLCVLVPSVPCVTRGLRARALCASSSAA